MSSIENLRGKKCKAKYLDGQYYQATIVAVLQEFDGNLKYRVKWENYDEESHCYDIRSISSDDEDGKQEEDDDAEEKEQLIHGVRATAISEKEKQDHFPDPSHPAPSPPLPLLGHPSEHDSAREYVNPERLRRVSLDIRRRRNNTFGAAAGDSGGSGEEYVKNGSRVSSSRQNNRRCSNYNEQSSKGKIHDSSEQSNKSGNVGYGGAANYFSDIRTTGKQGGGRGNDQFSVENEHRTHHKMGPYQHNHSRSHHHQHYHHQLQKQQQVGKTPSNENHRNSNNPYFQNNDNIKHDKGRRRWGSGGFQNHHYYHQNQHHHHERRNNGKQHAHRNQNEAKSWSYSSSERLNEIKTGNYQKKTRSVGDNVNQLKRGDDDVQIDIDQVYKSDVFFTQLNGLRKEVKRALMEDRITSCSLVQARCLPSILEWKKDGICQAPSGTGKTTMLCIALINSVDTSKNYCQALCTVPVRELATQIHQKVLRLGRFITPQMKASLLVPMSSCLLSHCHIAVGTNGKTRDICIEKKKIDISKLRVHVIDEADKLLDCSVSQEFNQRTQTLELMHYTRTSIYQGYDQKQNPPPQLVMFLATLPKMLRKNLTQHLTEGYFQETVLRESHLVMPNIKHFFVTHDGGFDRYKALDLLFGMFDIGQTIIFVNSIKSADNLAYRLKDDGHDVTELYGPLGPEERDRRFQQFCDKETTVLITTDVLARGVDVVTTNFVVNYEIPVVLGDNRKAAADEYLHRVGRSGRFKRQGIAINFLYGRRDEERLNEIAQHFNIELRRLHISNATLPELEKLIEKEQLTQNMH